jgi:hypothetical protein
LIKQISYPFLRIKIDDPIIIGILGISYDWLFNTQTGELTFINGINKKIYLINRIPTLIFYEIEIIAYLQGQKIISFYEDKIVVQKVDSNQELNEHTSV